VLLAIYLDKDFIDVEGVTVTSVFSFQSTGINRSKLDAPEADRFTADGDSSFSEEVFYISVAEIEAIVEPDAAGNDVWRKSVAFISIHSPILPVTDF
jgi:hypothetical protein